MCAEMDEVEPSLSEEEQDLVDQLYFPDELDSLNNSSCDETFSSPFEWEDFMFTI